MQNWDAKIYEVIKRADILFLNEIEALQLSGKADAVRELGKHCPTVVVKLWNKRSCG